MDCFEIKTHTTFKKIADNLANWSGDTVESISGGFVLFLGKRICHLIFGWMCVDVIIPYPVEQSQQLFVCVCV